MAGHVLQDHSKVCSDPTLRLITASVVPNGAQLQAVWWRFIKIQKLSDLFSSPQRPRLTGEATFTRSCQYTKPTEAKGRHR